MKLTLLRLLCLLLIITVLSLLQSIATGSTHPLPPQQAPEHGGQIDAKYDGFTYETIVALRKMKVVCGNSKGTASGMKGICVNIAASLHSPGQQLDYVRYAKLRLVFETKDWYGPHPLGQRDLIAVVDNESIRLGTMQLAKQDLGSDRGVDHLEEILEVSVPYATFAKIARGTSVEFKVGPTMFGLKEKNLAALRDLNNRVRIKTTQLQD